MKIEISKIKVTNRIRQQINKIEELAADIERNGLLNPITVMPMGEGYQLLAGLRRLRAVQLLCWTEIDVNVISPRTPKPPCALKSPRTSNGRILPIRKK